MGPQHVIIGSAPQTDQKIVLLLQESRRIQQKRTNLLMSRCLGPLTFGSKSDTTNPEETIYFPLPEMKKACFSGIAQLL